MGKKKDTLARNDLWSTLPSDALKVGDGFALSNVEAGVRAGFEGKRKDGEALLAAGGEELLDLQERLFAASTQGVPDRVLLVLQGMDTAGKGGIVRHVLGAVEPQGVQVTAFKKPTEEEASHHFLWRVRNRVPAPGVIGVFDRSHYEDVLIQRVRQMAPLDEIQRRYGEINQFEQELVESGVRIVKVMLHIDRDEQRERLLSRLDRDDKRWKFTPNDIAERALWDKYQDAFQIVFDRTSTEIAPWYVVPGNSKWYARIAVQQILLTVLRGIDPQWPAVSYDVEDSRRQLLES